MESIEWQTLRKNVLELEIALKENFNPIIGELRNQGLIKDSTYERVQSTRLQFTEEERARELVRSIEDVVKVSSENYVNFIEILSRNRLYKDILKKLKSTHGGKYPLGIASEVFVRTLCCSSIIYNVFL